MQRARLEVQREAAEVERLALLRRRRRRQRAAAAQHRLHAREQLARIERLAEVVVRAEFQPDDAVDVVRTRGEHDHRDVVARRAQLAQRREPVDARHHQVEHDQIRALAFEPPLERARVVQHRHLDALPDQIVAQQIAQFDVVVDNKYLSSHGMKFNAQQDGFSICKRPSRVTGCYGERRRVIPRNSRIHAT